MKNNIIITGAASGIGRATFESLNQNLFDQIVLVDINPIEIEDDKVIAIKCDISSED
jgi:NAD(P)-dependent dehydrogenase (short-subunit alcohol dehydrogenase family)